MKNLLFFVLLATAASLSAFWARSPTRSNANDPKASNYLAPPMATPVPVPTSTSTQIPTVTVTKTATRTSTITRTPTPTPRIGQDWIEAVSSLSGSFGGRWHHAAIKDGFYHYVIGGDLDITASTGYMNDVWRSSDGVSWTQMVSTAEFSPRAGHCVCEFNGNMYLIGGSYYNGSGTAYYNDIWESSNGGWNWSLITASAPFSGRAFHTCVVHDNKLWVMGGQSAVQGDVWYSANGTAWTLATATPAWGTATYFTAVSVGTNLWLLGGSTWYSSDGINWTLGTSSPGYPSNSRFAVANGKFYSTGGSYASSPWYASEVWTSIDGVIWSQLMATSPWSGRFHHSMHSDGSKIWTIGGYPPLSTQGVWYSP